jgi:hypothetical protein
MLHQRFPQRKRFAAFFAGFLHVSRSKSVEIAILTGFSQAAWMERSRTNGVSVQQLGVEDSKTCGAEQLSQSRPS